MFQQRIVFSAPVAGVRLADGPRASQDAHAAAIGDMPHAVSHPEYAIQIEQERAAIQEALAAVAESVREIEQRRIDSLHELQRAAVHIGVAIASHLVRQTIAADELPIEKLVAESITRLAPSQALSVRLHPDDLSLLQSRFAGKPPPWNAHSEIQVLPDATLSRGDCRADAEKFGVLSRLDEHMADIQHQLLNSLEHAQVERRRHSPNDRVLGRFPDRRETA